MSAETEALARLEEVYRRVPEVHCRGLCADQCTLIPFTEIEGVRIGLKHPTFPLPLPNGTCACLVDGRCSIYANRPLICRLWGAVRGMPCPHGCRPRRYLEDREAHALFSEISRL